MTESVSIIPIGNKFKVHVTGRKHALRCFKNYEECIVWVARRFSYQWIYIHNKNGTVKCIVEV